jgi:hypothetical protein
VVVSVRTAVVVVPAALTATSVGQPVSLQGEIPLLVKPMRPLTFPAATPPRIIVILSCAFWQRASAVAGDAVAVGDAVAGALVVGIAAVALGAAVPAPLPPLSATEPQPVTPAATAATRPAAHREQ